MRPISIEFWALLAISGFLLAETTDREIGAFRAYWQGRQVYLLIPRDQGDKRGLRKTTHLEFFTGRRDLYPRRVTVQDGQVWFELHTVRSVKCTPQHYEIRLNRPACPDETVLGLPVSVILDIKKGELPVTPQSASDILVSVVIEKDQFPRVLWIGEGPYGTVRPEIDLSWLHHVTRIRRGMRANQLSSHLGPPLDEKSVRIGDQSYQYLWYFGYRFFAVTKRGQVIHSSILYF